MRTHVSKMQIGVGVAGAAAVLALGTIVCVPWSSVPTIITGGNTGVVAAAADEFGFVKAVDDGAGGLNYDVLGPFESGLVSDAVSNPTNAGTAQVQTLTVDVTKMVDQKVYIVKVAYHDNLSIIPNQIKFTTVAFQYLSTMTNATVVALIKAKFDAQDFIFVTVTTGATTVIFTGKTLQTASNYNHIDRPEMVVFEVGAPDAPTGAFAVTATTPVVLPQGTAAQIAWLEEQHMGRRGYSDRRSWFNTKKYPSQLVAGVTAYDTLIITASKIAEGELQDTRNNPIGAVIAAAAAGIALLVTDFETITGLTVNVIQHPVDA